MTEASKPSPRGVRCEVHGLLYDPSQPGGCVLCRREGGQPAGSAAPAAAPTGTPDSALGPALAVTAGLILLTALGFYSAHQTVAALISGIVSGEALQAGMSPEELEKAGIDPRLQEALDAIEELEEIEARRYGGDEGYAEEDYPQEEYGEGY